MNDGPSSCPRAGVVFFSTLKLRRPLDTLLGRDRLNGIFEHHVEALRTFECVDIPEYSVQRIGGAHHRRFALRACHDAPTLED
jgi:hypothetical protein